MPAKMQTATFVSMRGLLIGLILFNFISLTAQDTPFPARNNSSKKAEKPVYGIYADYGIQTPFVDLRERFGFFNSIGAGVWYKVPAQASFGFSIRPFFGSRVFEPNLLGDMAGPSGSPIDQNGMLHMVRAYMRGYHTQLQIGRLFPVTANTQSGIHMQAGVGFLQHKIKFSYDERSLPQLNKPYQYGYDRLCNGITTSMAINLQHVDVKNGLSGFIGVESVIGFTENRRNMNYPTQSAEAGMRGDHYLSFKGGILIPVFRKKRDDEEFFN
jgi:hypothetical protein